MLHQGYDLMPGTWRVILPAAVDRLWGQRHRNFPLGKVFLQLAHLLLHPEAVQVKGRTHRTRGHAEDHQLQPREFY